MKRKESTKEQRREALRLYREGHGPYLVSKRTGVCQSVCDAWKLRYESGDLEWAEGKSARRRIPAGVKAAVVRDYLAGKGGQRALAKEYGLRSPDDVRRWVDKYRRGLGEDAGAEVRGRRVVKDEERERRRLERKEADRVKDLEAEVAYLRNYLDVCIEMEGEPKKKERLRRLRERYREEFGYGGR